MKKTYWLSILVLLLIFISLPAWNDSGGILDVLVVAASKLDAHYRAIEDLASAWAASRGLKITVTAPSLPTAWAQQQEMEPLLKKRWDVICIEPLGTAELSPLLENAKDRGSVIVTLRKDGFPAADHNVEPFSNEEMGRRMMQSLAKAMGEDGFYITLVPSFENDDIVCAEKAAVEFQKLSYGGMFSVDRLVETDADVSKARDIVRKDLEHYSIGGVLFFTSEDGLGVSGLIGADGKKIVSVGMGDPATLKMALDEKNIDCLLYWSRENMFLAGLEIGRAAAEGRIPDTARHMSLPIEGYETIRRGDGNTWTGNDIRSIYPGNK
ncbi:MAG: substrate-binding domain-containing protein [Synergistaceae bacterium]|jgi:simple sugar transport system substrate-binding protein|nr:substrate-binding domain-containing protein [Synergistaceae bacterium]